MCIHIYAYTYNICMYIHICIHVYVRGGEHTCEHIYIYKCLHVYIHGYIYIYVYIGTEQSSPLNSWSVDVG